MRAIVRPCIEKMDTPICSKQARRRFLSRRERRGLRAAIMSEGDVPLVVNTTSPERF